MDANKVDQRYFHKNKIVTLDQYIFNPYGCEITNCSHNFHLKDCFSFSQK